MPGWRCQVQDCDQGHNDEAEISIHNSPRSGSVRLKWKNFVCLHRKNSNPGPVGKLPVCSDHLTNDCRTRAYRMKGLARRLKPGAIPSIWKKTSAPISQRSRRRVEGVLLSIISLSVAFPRESFSSQLCKSGVKWCWKSLLPSRARDACCSEGCRTFYGEQVKDSVFPLIPSPSFVFSLITRKLQLALKGGNFESCLDCELIYRPGKDAENPADFISRHPSPSDPELLTLGKKYVHYVCSNAVPKAMTLKEIKHQSNKNWSVEQSRSSRIQETERWIFSIQWNSVEKKQDCHTSHLQKQSSWPGTSRSPGNS